MKLETYLRMAALPFELVDSGDVIKAPEGKLPYIDDGGTIVADTSFVIDYLKGSSRLVSRSDTAAMPRPALYSGVDGSLSAPPAASA